MGTRRLTPAPNGPATRVLTRVYLLLLFLELAAAGLWMVHSSGAYGLPEWLINYAGGFVRRGLTGSVLLPVGHVLHVPLTLAPALLGILCYAVLFLCLDRLLAASRWRWWAYALALCPGMFAFPVISRTSFRKDVLFFALLSAVILYLRGEKHRRRPLLAAGLTVALPVLVLCQEPLFVYFPYLLAALFIALKSFKPVLSVVGPGLLLAGVALLCVSIERGTPAQAERICAAAGYPSVQSCPSGITIEGAPPLDVSGTMRTYGYLRYYPVDVLLCLIPVFAAAGSLWRTPVTRPALRVIAAAAVISAVGSIQLFRLGVDWGRWINLHMISLTLLLLWVDSSMPHPQEPAPAISSRAPRPLHKAAAIAALAIYSTCWSVPGNLDRPLYGYLSLLHRVLHFNGSLSSN